MRPAILFGSKCECYREVHMGSEKVLSFHGYMEESLTVGAILTMLGSRGRRSLCSLSLSLSFSYFPGLIVSEYVSEYVSEWIEPVTTSEDVRIFSLDLLSFFLLMFVNMQAVHGQVGVGMLVACPYWQMHRKQAVHFS